MKLRILTSGLILLSPGKIYYGLNEDIYEITSNKVAKFIWNRYNVATEYTWDRYNTNIQTAYRGYDVTGTIQHENKYVTVFNGIANWHGNDHHIYIDPDLIGDDMGLYSGKYMPTDDGNEFDPYGLDGSDIPVLDYTPNAGITLNVFRENRFSIRLDGLRVDTHMYAINSTRDRTQYYEFHRDYDQNLARLTYTDPYYEQDFNVKVELSCDHTYFTYTRKSTYDIKYNVDSWNNTYQDNHTKYYVRSASDDKYSQGTYIDQVSSPSASAYPANDHSGSYWYVSAGSQQTQGSFIDTVESNIENAYPDNGIQDGYWYVKQ